MASNAANKKSADQPDILLNPFLDKRGGKPSKIHDYCVDVSDGDTKCVWLCKRQGRTVVAWDVPFDDVESSSVTLSRRNQSRWWSRYSFYSYIGVRHVQIKFLEAKKNEQGFPVIARPVNHGDEVAEVQRFLEQSLQDADSNFDIHSCGVSKEGYRHPEGERCVNWIEDDSGSRCPTLEYAKEKNKMRQWKWMSEHLDYYWDKGIKADAIRYLDACGFFLSYHHLSMDCYEDAEDPYGKSVDALELISGWRIQRILWTTFVAIIVDVCVVAMATLLSGSVGTALSAGSYAIGIEALLLGLLTMLSAILP